jgi:hypothetical protein
MAVAVEHAEKPFPWTHGISVLMSHYPGQLVNMRQVVRGPCGQKLRQGDRAERGMLPSTHEILWLQVHPPQFLEVPRTQVAEFIQKLRQRLTRTLPLLRQTIKPLKRSGFTTLQDYPRPCHPIGAFPMNEMTDNIERAPGVSAFIADRPTVGQIAEKDIESSGRASKQRDCVFQVVFHLVLMRQWQSSYLL